jgi:hypothetical protein
MHRYCLTSILFRSRLTLHSVNIRVTAGRIPYLEHIPRKITSVEKRHAQEYQRKLQRTMQTKEE